ncbi:MAG: hypothetical protein C4K49_02730 [Candidatus Thorarchaeota archaeon]|nr:MAG: hypothetical protein C4K49_02730 [Candidatus Thorarchaeota archaeon]
MQIRDANKQITHLSSVFTNILMERGLLESKLFPVNAYICVGFYQTYARLYDVMKQVWQKTTPEELAKKSKTLLSEVQALSTTYLWLYYSLARMGVIFNKFGGDVSKEPKEKREQWLFMLDNWYRLATNYFNTGKPTVAASGGTNLAFDKKTISWLVDHLQPVTEEKATKTRRAIASVDLYAFMEECEARAKIIDHGPYPLDGGEVLVVSEYTNLYDGTGDLWLPWSKTDAKLPSSSLGVAMTLKGASVTFNDVGTMTVEPGDYSKLVTKMGAYTKRAGKVVPIGLDELSAYAQAADAAQAELYMKFAEWDRKQLLIAGATAYWRGFARFTNQVGITKKIDWGLSPSVVEEYLPKFMEVDADPAFFRMFREPEELEKDPTLYLLPG